MVKNHSIFKATFLVSLLTFLSRLLGFVRDILMATLFGASAGFDAFLVAFRIPNFMRGLFAEGSFSQAFVPTFRQVSDQQGAEGLRQFTGKMIRIFCVMLLIITVCSELLAPLLVIIFAPGFLHDPIRYQMALSMFRVTLPYLAFISLGAFLASILISQEKFSVASFTPVLLNVVLIVVAFFLTPFYEIPEQALALGVLMAGILQMVFQIPFLARYRLLPSPYWRVATESKDLTSAMAIRRVFKGLVPALLGVSVVQLGLLIDTFFASFLQKGSISWLYYADRLTFFPLGIFGVALATVMLPHLSKLHNNALKDEIHAILDWSFRMILIIGIPAALGLFLLSGPLTATLFGHGKFNAFDILMTQKSIMTFAIGLPAFMVVKVISSAIYATHDLRTPAKIALVSIMINIVLNCLLIIPLAHAGLALATSIAAIVNAGLLFKLLLKMNLYQPLAGWNIFMMRLLAANITMSAFLVSVMRKVLSLHHLLLVLAIAVLIYMGVLLLSGMRFRDFVSHRNLKMINSGNI